jgi:pantoate--beta-alanine ligase
VTKLITLSSELDRKNGTNRAVVPTMGALHQGHLDLVDAARERVGSNGEVVVTIFVNPTQFGHTAEFEHYPRTLESDFEKCQTSGVDIVFAPSAAEMYPDAGAPPQYVSVQPGPLGAILEGADRPGHFAGVLTIVAKLLNLTKPDFAFFGEKDYQQLILISQMVRQLNFPVHIIGTPTRREPDGLAMSSRNVFLDSDQRSQATLISQALVIAQATDGSVAEKLRAARLVLGDKMVTCYLVAMSSDLSQELAVTNTNPEGRLLFAGVLGGTRLIDNMPIEEMKTR